MTRKALPGRPGEAYCPKCRRAEPIRTVFRNGREEYVMHGHVPGGGVSCHNSGQPVVPPKETRL